MRLTKKPLLLILGAFLSFVVLFIGWQFVKIGAGGGIGKVPEEGVVISEKYNVCLHKEANQGSGDWINLATYYCDQEVDWGEGEKVGLDWIGSGECVDIYLKDEGNSNSKTLYLRDTFWCSTLYGEQRKEIKYKVNHEGKFEKLGD